MEVQSNAIAATKTMKAAIFIVPIFSIIHYSLGFNGLRLFKTCSK